MHRRLYHTRELFRLKNIKKPGLNFIIHKYKFWLHQLKDEERGF